MLRHHTSTRRTLSRRLFGVAAGLSALALSASALGAGAPTPDLASIERQLAAREYWATENARGLQAPNRSHDLRTYFTPEGVTIVGRSSDTPLVSIELARLGRGDDFANVPDGTLVSRQDRVEIRRPGLVEWLVNRPTGLEQGFTLEERPRGDGELALELAISGADIRLSPAGDAILLETAGGRSLRYDKLLVLDADENVIRSRFEMNGPGRVRLVVSDASATYPLTIDPLLTGTPDATLTGARIESMASAGDVNGDGYEDLIVGAPWYDSGESYEGAAFVFHGGPSGIGSGNLLAADAVIEGNQIGGLVGHSVSGAGDVNGDGYDDVVVGAHLFDTSACGDSPEPCNTIDVGVALVLHGGPGGIGDRFPWTSDAYLHGNRLSGYFGRAVSHGDVNGDGYGDVLITSITAPYSGSNKGAVYAFHGGPGGIGHRGASEADGSFDSQALSNLFPAVTSISTGDVNGDGYDDVVAGVPFHDAGQNNEGAVFLLHGGSGGIGTRTPSTADASIESNVIGGFMGELATIAGDVDDDGYDDILVDGPPHGSDPYGAVYFYRGSASGVPSGTPESADTVIEHDPRSLIGLGDANGDGFGDVAVGYGAYAVVYPGGASGLNTTPLVTIEESSQPTLGRTKVGAADVNSDGYADLLVRFSTSDDLALYHGGPPPPTQCTDGFDNDGDGLVDLADPDCADAADDAEWQLSSNDLIVADPLAGSGNGAIVRVDPLTEISTVLSSDGPFEYPESVTQGHDGALYVADSLAKAVFRLDPDDGSVTVVWQGSPFESPYCIERATEAGLLLVTGRTSSGGSAVFLVDERFGIPLPVSVDGLLALSFGMAVEPGSNDVLVSDLSTDYVIRVDLETGSQTIVSDFWNIDPPWIESDVLPAGMTIDPNGDLVVAEAWTGDVYRVSLPEGGDPVPLTSGGPFTWPTAVAFLGDGTLVVTDAWGVDKLHKIAPGSTTPIAFATDAPLVSPTDVFALPEPGTATMLVPGLGLILALGRRRAERRCH